MEVLLSVAVPVPIYGSFDYRIGTSAVPSPGCRVEVVFNRRTLIGIVVSEAREPGETEPLSRFRPLEKVIDTEPLLSPAMMALGQWIADYYHHPIGEVLTALLPVSLRRGEPAQLRATPAYRLTEGGLAALGRLPARSQRLRALLDALRQQGAVSRAGLNSLQGIAASLRRSLDEGWVELAAEALPSPLKVADAELPLLTPDQARAVEALEAVGSGFSAHLLQGVTGSGKTEVYLRAIAKAIAHGGQVLLLVPEIGLTPQLLDRVRERFGETVVDGYHSGLNDAARGQVWLRAASGRLPIVVGTRSAALLPMPRLALIIVDEEHDTSFKQQDGLRYSARDVAVLRGSRENAPVILGSATPSLETLQRVQAQRYSLLRLPRRVKSVDPPRLQLLDVRGQPFQQGLAPLLVAAIERHLQAGGQVLLFINRRGYAPALICHDCGWTATCTHCDARLTWHRGRGRLICHHCGARQAPPSACPQCKSTQMLAVGHGTERIEESLRTRFPEARVERFDSDRLRSVRALQALLKDTREGRVNILVGTQMLAKGHDFAGLSLVGVVDADQALFSVDFRAIERMGQLLTQVAGRAGRSGQRGEVIVQTHQPDHPALRRLIEASYDGLAALLLHERADAQLPPFSHLALLRAEASTEENAMDFLEAAGSCLPSLPGVQKLGPVPAPMERRAGRFRAQLLIQALDRVALHRALTPWLPLLDTLPGARGLRWSIDVDPVDLY